MTKFSIVNLPVTRSEIEQMCANEGLIQSMKSAGEDPSGLAFVRTNTLNTKAVFRWEGNTLPTSLVGKVVFTGTAEEVWAVMFAEIEFWSAPLF